MALLTPRQAATELGISPAQVRYLIRQGTIRAKKFPMPGDSDQFTYQILLSEVNRLRGKVGYANGQTKGYPKGRKRL